MFNIIKHAHSGLRYIVLILILLAIVQAFSKKNETNFKDKAVALAALIIVHIQVLLGLFLYFTSEKVQHVSGMMKDSLLRFYGVEHILGMIIGAILITIGYKKAKAAGFRPIFVYYIIGFIIILVSIPWPFRIPGTTWF